MHDLATTFLIFAAKYLFVAPIVILAAYFLAQPWPAKKRMARFAMPALALTYVAGVVSNHLYVDPRPFVVGHFTPLVPHAPDNGFPSDHTLLVSALAAIGTIGAIPWAESSWCSRSSSQLPESTSVCTILSTSSAAWRSPQ